MQVNSGVRAYQNHNREGNELFKKYHDTNTIYRPPTNRRRGLIDGIGSIAKSLFGTMDANDEKLINEQIQLLQNKQLMLQHAVQNQLTVSNSIAHMENIESIIDRNEKLLREQIMRYREEINEHYLVLIADLMRFNATQKI